MDINVKAFQDAIAEDNFEKTTHTVTQTALLADPAAALAPLFADLDQALAAGNLLQASLVADGEDEIGVRLETGVINLPFADSKKVANFVAADSLVPLKVYLIITSPFVNVSHLRIDEVTTVDNYLAGKNSQQAAVIADVQEKLDVIETNRKTPKPAAPAPAARITSRSTTTRGKTPRKPSARTTNTVKAGSRKKTTAKTATKAKVAPKTTAKSTSKAPAKTTSKTTTKAAAKKSPATKTTAATKKTTSTKRTTKTTSTKAATKK
ncbi:hypothetical protein [Lacticaseibacillus yichunensis]|uniref:Uncharacterized protein n=1 Tax=Lacticaseibacillus yichunensis TaxID=2486015 RepID=A0ABW4CNX8_9LACO|nr:hypothetical protein [Lacticaseibacillus yichunensis]